MIINGLAIVVPVALAIAGGWLTWLYMRRDEGRHVLADSDAATLAWARELHHEEYLPAPPGMGPGAGACKSFHPVTTATCAGAQSTPKVDRRAPADPAAAVVAPIDPPSIPLPPPPVHPLDAKLAQIHAIAAEPIDDYLTRLERPWAESTGEFSLQALGLALGEGPEWGPDPAGPPVAIPLHDWRERETEATTR